MTKKRYKAGEQIKNLPRFIVLYRLKRPIYLRNKYLTHGFYEHWTLSLIVRSIKAGVFYEAEKIKNGS